MPGGSRKRLYGSLARIFPKDWLEITQAMACRLKNGDHRLPPDYIPTQCEYGRAVGIAGEFIGAN